MRGRHCQDDGQALAFATPELARLRLAGSEVRTPKATVQLSFDFGLPSREELDEVTEGIRLPQSRVEYTAKKVGGIFRPEFKSWGKRCDTLVDAIWDSGIVPRVSMVDCRVNGVAIDGIVSGIPPERNA